MISLYGHFEGRFGGANKFMADNWNDYEFLPCGHSWFTPDDLAEESGRGWMKIADWLARKNKWTEMGEPNVKDDIHNNGQGLSSLNDGPAVDPGLQSEGGSGRND
jgi:hypothetical protein